ncbi:MAG: HAMP domain-containing protein [Gemmatimonadetes bacterium]|nr:HAMP domain-containing protein [Gemmatimonadota bacterium]MBT6147777.1 HAMP domain-containing protein [Gemmatimonadota bacterium]MBT7859768.1 HAMP domain-containing protein [Gemmatimonadota bacterium]
MSLSSRIFALIAAVSLAGLGGLGWLETRAHTDQLEQATIRGGIRLSETLSRSTRVGMLQNRKQDVYGALQMVGDQAGIERIRIYNKEGTVVFSTDSVEIGRVVDTGAEACTRCHVNSGQPVIRPAEEELTRIFRLAEGHRVLGLITPVYNESSCAGVDCHPGPDQQNILGVIDLQLSLAGVDASLSKDNERFLLLTYSLMLIVAAVSGWFVWRWVHIPVKALIHGTERLRAGQLDYRIKLTSKNEIGQLATSFNDMSLDLSVANRQLTEWARTLEDRVEEKTATLRQAQAKLIHSEKMASLGTLSAVVAHEINNPLSGVLTYARLVRRHLERDEQYDDSEQLQEHLRTIERETTRCGAIVRNLLEFSRQVPVSPREVDLHDILERTLMLIRHKLELQKIHLDVKRSPSLPPVICDAEQIQQALLAVLMNATEAMPDGGHLQVVTRSCSESQRNGWVALQVVDDGSGIPGDVLPRIFEPFFTTKNDLHGVGLGLSVVHGIIGRHGGEIDVDSRPGCTSFTLNLPRHGPLEDTELSTEGQQWLT